MPCADNKARPIVRCEVPADIEVCEDTLSYSVH